MAVFRLGACSGAQCEKTKVTLCSYLYVEPIFLHKFFVSLHIFFLFLVLSFCLEFKRLEVWVRALVMACSHAQ